MTKFGKKKLNPKQMNILSYQYEKVQINEMGTKSET